MGLVGVFMSRILTCAGRSGLETELTKSGSGASVGKREAVGALGFEWGRHGAELVGGHRQKVCQFQAESISLHRFRVVELFQVGDAHVDVGLGVARVAVQVERGLQRVVGKRGVVLEGGHGDLASA